MSKRISLVYYDSDGFEFRKTLNPEPVELTKDVHSYSLRIDSYLAQIQVLETYIDETKQSLGEMLIAIFGKLPELVFVWPSWVPKFILGLSLVMLTVVFGMF